MMSDEELIETLFEVMTGHENMDSWEAANMEWVKHEKKSALALLKERDAERDKRRDELSLRVMKLLETCMRQEIKRAMEEAKP